MLLVAPPDLLCLSVADLPAHFVVCPVVPNIHAADDVSANKVVGLDTAEYDHARLQFRKSRLIRHRVSYRVIASPNEAGTTIPHRPDT